MQKSCGRTAFKMVPNNPDLLTVTSLWGAPPHEIMADPWGHRNTVEVLGRDSRAWALKAP